MKICLCITRMFLFFFFYFIPTFLFSTAQFSHPTHHLGNASDQEALLRFLSGITHDPSQSLLTTWKPNVSFCNWTGVICSRRRQRVVSLNVSSVGLEGKSGSKDIAGKNTHTKISSPCLLWALWIFTHKCMDSEGVCGENPVVLLSNGWHPHLRNAQYLKPFEWTVQKAALSALIALMKYQT